MKTRKKDYHNSPIAWFYILMLARNRGDDAAEKKAVKNLERLGVQVLFKKAGLR